MLIFSILLSSISLVVLVVLYTKVEKKDNAALSNELRSFLQEELKNNREELSLRLRENREELSQQLRFIQEGINLNAKESRESMTAALKDFQLNFTQNLKNFSELQKESFASMSQKQDDLITSTELKLEKMRETVDEKLHKTLEERLGRSFKLVSERLEAVQKGLGEMQQLANGVGDLKKVLSNVKTRGVLGEIQLGNILEQILAPEQYDANVMTKLGSNCHVEYAIKLPGALDHASAVYLPIDAKFPQEDYLRLQEAFDLGDSDLVESSGRQLEGAVKKFAKDIHQKYVDPPNTTDFAIMFLPVEGLYAEIAKRPDLIALLQREYQIIVTGPTTLAAMLNSLQMGFKTLAIQKQSSEVWKVLGAVKTEFGRFGTVLDKAQKKLFEANNELDTLVGTRTKMMLSKLRKVEELPGDESSELLES